MKVTIELDTDVATDFAVYQLVFGLPVAAPGATKAAPIMPPPPEDDTSPDTQPDVPYLIASRPYGDPEEGRARRTKVQLAEDADIEQLFAEATKAGIKGLPKSIPNGPASEFLTELRYMLEEAETPGDASQNDDGDGFKVDDEDEAEPMDLDEFRAILGKAMKALGGKTVSEAMKPHKSATDVPEDQRNEYAATLLREIDAA
jgi:hypothetical protein